MVRKEDKVISEFLRSIGPWKKSVIIIGGYALIIYKLYLADRRGHLPVGTKDIDSLIPRKVPMISETNIAIYLKEAGFTKVFKDHAQPATESYFKEIQGEDIEVEFLTDSLTRDEKFKNVAISGVVAQPLNYLELSLRKKMEFTTNDAETGNVVSPGAWMFHKGLTFKKRVIPSKVFKDL